MEIFRGIMQLAGDTDVLETRMSEVISFFEQCGTLSGEVADGLSHRELFYHLIGVVKEREGCNDLRHLSVFLLFLYIRRRKICRALHTPIYIYVDEKNGVVMK